MKEQIKVEINWLKDKLATIPLKRVKYRKTIEHQIKQKELNLSLGVFKN